MSVQRFIVAFLVVGGSTNDQNTAIRLLATHLSNARYGFDLTSFDVVITTQPTRWRVACCSSSLAAFVDMQRECLELDTASGLTVLETRFRRFTGISTVLVWDKYNTREHAEKIERILMDHCSTTGAPTDDPAVASNYTATVSIRMQKDVTSAPLSDAERREIERVELGVYRDGFRRVMRYNEQQAEIIKGLRAQLDQLAKRNCELERIGVSSSNGDNDQTLEAPPMTPQRLEDQLKPVAQRSAAAAAAASDSSVRCATQVGDLENTRLSM